MKILIRTISGLVILCFMQGCLVRAVVGVAAETIEAGVELTGAAAGAVVDVAIPDGDDKKDKDEDDD